MESTCGSDVCRALQKTRVREAVREEPLGYLKKPGTDGAWPCRPFPFLNPVRKSPRREFSKSNQQEEDQRVTDS